jgi:ankyrin repeat protein|tara:strand:- start:2558 stop:4513 length:1956 start_codon:yes stop_codon:yes gene_type:complete
MNSKMEVCCDGNKGGSRVGNKCGDIDSVNERIRCVPDIKIISEFIVACENGDIQMVKFWWGKNPSILQAILNEMCYEEDLFYIMCERGHLQVAKWIIKNNPNYVSIIHFDLMTDVCLAGKLSMAKWILTLCPDILVDVDEDEGDGYYLFRSVCKKGHLNVAKWLAQVNPEFIESVQKIHVPFWECCEKGNLNMARWIYSNSPEEVCSLEKDTASYEYKISMFDNVCIKGHIAVVQWLLTIMPTISDADDIRMIFHQTCMAGHLNIAKCLFKSYPNTNISMHDDHTFRMVCSWGRLNVAKWLLKIKPDIDIRAETDHAFYEACRYGHLEVAKWLLHIKSDIDIRAETDHAFYDACINGHLEVAKWLFDINPGIEISIDNVINTVKANTDVVKWLFEIMPELYSFSRICGLVTAFKMSCLTGNLELVKLIFEKQAEYITVRSVITNSAFARACHSGNMALINWIDSQFSNINISENNESAFISACTNGHFMLAKRLLELKPDINISTNDDKAFKKACENGHLEVFRWLENMFPEKYSVGQPMYLENDTGDYDSDEDDLEEELRNSHGELISNYTYGYTISKFINITQNILAEDIPKEIDDCSICLDSRSNVYTSCSHLYCKPCISKWLKTHDTCPCCRVELQDENMSNIDFKS